MQTHTHMPHARLHRYLPILSAHQHSINISSYANLKANEHSLVYLLRFYPSVVAHHTCINILLPFGVSMKFECIHSILQRTVFVWIAFESTQLIISTEYKYKPWLKILENFYSSRRYSEFQIRCSEIVKRIPVEDINEISQAGF